ncbi:MAG: septation regulator SpoVG [Candidatus Dependentiae bacterium]|nr:septation regulator SpoVG [Candidatus Dependentiae bacterium]
MEITEIKVFPTRDGGRLKAYATVVFDNCFIIRDLKVIEGQKGLFVSMPSRKRKDGSFRDIVHPLNVEMRTKIEQGIIEEFDRVIKLGEDVPTAETQE